MDPQGVWIRVGIEPCIFWTIKFKRLNHFSEQVECCSESISTKKINFEEVLEGSQDRLSRNVNLVFKRKWIIEIRLSWKRKMLCQLERMCRRREEEMNAVVDSIDSKKDRIICRRWWTWNVLRYFSANNTDENSFSRELIHAALEACGTIVETRMEMSEEKKDDDQWPEKVIIASRQLFLVLLVIAFTATAVWVIFIILYLIEYFK